MGWPQLAAKHPHSCLFTFLHHNRTGEKIGRIGMRKVRVSNKDREITHKKYPDF